MNSCHTVCADIEPAWGPGIPADLTNRLDLWKIRLPATLEIPEEINSVLNSGEKNRSSRFHRIEDKQNFIMRRGVLRILLSQYAGVAADELTFIEGHNKKPELKGNHGIYFNVSHSGSLALIGISDQQLGVDIEKVDQTFDIDGILPYGFNSQEVRHIKNSKNAKCEFFKLWTRKEALIKATAKGLDNDLTRIPVFDGYNRVDSDMILFPGSWLVSSFRLEDAFYASVAKCSEAASLGFYNFDLSSALIAR